MTRPLLPPLGATIRIVALLALLAFWAFTILIVRSL